MFVNSVASFYIARFLARCRRGRILPGHHPVPFTYWFPAERRGRATSLFLTAIAFASIIGGPTSGWILHSMGGGGMVGRAGSGCSCSTAIPSLVMGVVAWFYLEDRVKNAHWLTPAERELIARDILAEESLQARRPACARSGHTQGVSALLVYFASPRPVYGVSLAPTIIKAMGVQDPLDVGLISAFPWVSASSRCTSWRQRRPPPRGALAHPVMCFVGADRPGDQCKRDLTRACADPVARSASCRRYRSHGARPPILGGPRRRLASR